MNKFVILLALAISCVAADSVEEFVRELRASDASSAHGSQFLLCSETPWERSMEVTFFSISNPDDFLNGGKPILHEMSPIVLDELRSRVNCSVNIADMSINYAQNRYWSSKSGDLNQVVNTANIPFQRIGHVLCNDSNQQACMPSLVGAGEGYLKAATINDLLIRGVDLTAYKNELNLYSHIGGDYPELEGDRFGILSQLNFPKKFTVYSDDDQYGKIKLMDDQSELIWWKDNQNGICSQFPSTTGETFLGKITEQSVLHYYSEDICGTALLKYDSVDNSFGFPALKFVSYPESNGGDCFNTPASLPYGAIDVKPCQRGLPYVMSYPHFLEADASYQNKMEGMRPEVAKHQSYFIIEPVTGMLVESSQKYQLNIDVKKFVNHDNINGRLMVDTILPIYWFNKKYTLDSTHINAIKNMVENPHTSGTTTSTTPTPVNEDSPDFLYQSVDLKLNAISDKLSMFSTIVLSFVVIAVVILAAFSFMQFRHNRKILRRDHELPKYAPSYEVKH